MSIALAAERLRALLSGEVREQMPLALHTSWRTGGPADLWIEPGTDGELVMAIGTLNSLGVPWLILGKGSNVLVADAGVRGAVINLEAGLNWIREERHGETLCLAAGSGTPIAALLRYASDRHFVGVEMLTGVPGSVGGAVRMNAGTHLGEVSDALIDASVLDASSGQLELWPNERFAFVYRGNALDESHVVVSARFRGRVDPSAGVAEVMREVKARRRATQPLTFPSGGSTFVNPPGHKAWQLIDAAGLRGARVGEAQISEMHPNFIVNLGGATSSHIAALVRLAKESVLRHSGVALETEIRWLGDWPAEEVGP